MSEKGKKVLAIITIIVISGLALYLVGSFLYVLFTELGFFSDLLKTALYGVGIIIVAVVFYAGVLFLGLGVPYGILRWAISTVRGTKL